jgi:hypothetical protein
MTRVATPEQIGLAAQLRREYPDEALPQPLAVDEHDEGDDQDERRVEEDACGGRDEPEGVRGDGPRDLREPRRDLSVKLGHADREPRPLQTLLQSDDLARRAVAVLGSAHDQVVQLSHQSGDGECECPREDESDADIDHDYAERAIQRRPLVDAIHEG